MNTCIPSMFRDVEITSNLKALSLLGAFAYSALRTFSPIYYNVVLGAGPDEVSFITSGGWIAGMAGALHFGPIADKSPQSKEVLKKVITKAVAVSALLFVVTQGAQAFDIRGAKPFIDGSELERMLFIILVSSLHCTLFFYAGNIGSLIDIMVLRYRVEYGSIRAWLALGWGCSNCLMATMSDYLGIRIIFFNFWFFVSIMIWVLTRLQTEPQAELQKSLVPIGPESYRDVVQILWSRSRFRMLNLFVIGVLMTSIDVYLLLFVKSTFHSSGFFLGSMSLVMTLSEVPVFHYGQFLNRTVGINSCCIISLLALCCRTAVYVNLNRSHVWILPLLETLHGVSYALMWNASIDAARNALPDKSIGRGLAVVRGTYNGIGFSVGSLLTGGLSAFYGYRKMYLFVTVASLTWALVASVTLTFGL